MFLSLFNCFDCGKCTKGNITCQGKPHKTNNILSCPFHSLAYEIACETVIAKSKQIIHEEIGSCHTSIIESSHNVLLQFRSKNLNLQMLHYYVSTSLGLIQSNMSLMYVHKGPAYHWLLDLFGRMNLPRFDGMAEALKAINVSRFMSLSKVSVMWSVREEEQEKGIGSLNKLHVNYGLSNKRAATHLARRHLNHLAKEKQNKMRPQFIGGKKVN